MAPIIFKLLLTQKRAKCKNDPKRSEGRVKRGPELLVQCNEPLLRPLLFWWMTTSDTDNTVMLTGSGFTIASTYPAQK